MNAARFRIRAVLDRAAPVDGTVLIDRKTLMMSIRPLRSRRTYDAPLSLAASMVVARVIKTEAAAQRATKGGRRRPRRKVTL